jgi:hypothetical protein
MADFDFSPAREPAQVGTNVQMPASLAPLWNAGLTVSSFLSPDAKYLFSRRCSHFFIVDELIPTMNGGFGVWVAS